MIEKTCARCTKKIQYEEKYWLFGRFFCRFCKEFIETDKDHPYTYMKQLLDRFEQIEVQG